MPIATTTVSHSTSRIVKRNIGVRSYRLRRILAARSFD
jgi:hypothetical protein